MAPDRSADEVLGLLSDGTRVDVLRAVAVAAHEVDQPGSGSVPLSFSEIYERVDVDNTSKLSYHLGELTGTYLRKEEGGYVLTHAGERVVRFVLSGNYEQPPSFGPEPVSGRCLFCGESGLEASLADRFFRIDCTACDRQVAGHPVTPAQAAARDADELVRSVARKTARDYGLIRQGTCPECSGRLRTEVADLGEGRFPDADPFVVTSECEQCLREYNSPLTYSVAYHPASVAFHWERGVDVQRRGVWEFHGHLLSGRWTADRVDEGTGVYEVVLRRDGDALRVRLDSAATVLRTERVRREQPPERRS